MVHQAAGLSWAERSELDLTISVASAAGISQCRDVY